jgi:RND family efflux transporter MFP subunit
MTDDSQKRDPAIAAEDIQAAMPSSSGQLTVQAKRAQTLPHNPTPAHWSKWIGLAVAIVVMAGIALWFFQPWANKGLPVTAETLTSGPLVRVLAVNGRIAPLHLVDVRPTIGGQIMEVMVEEGATVTQGDVLLRVDASGQQAIVRQAVAGLDAGLVAQTRAEADLVRAEALQGNIARVTLDGARDARQTADQEVARLTALLDQAQIALERYTITSPITGTVLTRRAEVGQTVDATAILFSLADLGQLVVETDVDEGYAAQITPGLPAVLRLKGENDKLDGSVSFVAAQVDSATGGLAVKIAFDVPVTAPVGLTVTANIIVETKQSAITVPRAAVISDATGAAVFVVTAGQAVRRDVVIVDWPAERVEVTQGVVAGDAVIVDSTGLSDGLSVIVTTPATPAQ